MKYKSKAAAVEAVIKAARAEVGYAAKANKENKYAEYLTKLGNYYNGAKWRPGWSCDWCDIFVDYIFVKTFGNPEGRDMLYQPEKSLGAGCEYSANYFIKYGAWSKTPEVGDQGFLGIRGDEYHTGIVSAVSGNKITLIEGNAGGGNGKVVERTWTLNQFSGFGKPDYEMMVASDPGPSVKLSIDEITSELNKKAKATLRGEYGNGKARAENLGVWYEPVQWIINKHLGFIK